MGLVSLFRQFGSSVGTTVVGAIVGASAASAAVAEMAGAIQEAVLVQLAAGLVGLVMAWMIADLPLGSVRGSDLEHSAKGHSWSQVAVDH